MSKEIECLIVSCNSDIRKLESQLSSFFSVFADKLDLKEKLADKRAEVAVLYQRNNQYAEAIYAAWVAHDFYSKRPNSHSRANSQKCIDLLEIQVVCCKAISDDERYKNILGELLMKLPLAKSSVCINKIPGLLKDYLTIATVEESLAILTTVTACLDQNSYPDSSVYRTAIILKANLLCDKGQYKQAYKAYLAVIEQYESLRNKRSMHTTSLYGDERNAYITAYSLGVVHNFPVDKRLLNKIDELYEANKFYSRDCSVITKEKGELDETDPLRKVCLIYHDCKLTPPQWVPLYRLQRMSVQSAYSSNASTKRNNKKDYPVVETLDFLNEIDRTPEHEKIREKITLGWDQHGVGGYKNEVRELVGKLFIPRALSPEQLKTLAINLPRGGILYGPPGTGKTLMARTIAKYFFDEENVTVINGPALISKFVGESAQNLRNILEKARLNPSKTHVVIIDEIDALVAARSGGDDGLAKQTKADLTTTLLTYLDGVDQIPNLMIIGLTNYFERLDDALIRPGRLGLHIHIGLPSFDDRMAINTMYLADLQDKHIASVDLNIKMISEKSQGLSGAALKAFIDDTVEQYALSQIVSFEEGVLKIGDTKNIQPLTDQHFLNSLNKVKGKEKKTEAEILLSRPFCYFNQEMFQVSQLTHELAETFSYHNPLIIHVFGELGSGTSSMALNLFHESKDELVYMKAGDLLSLSLSEQQQFIEKQIANARCHVQGVLIIDDMDDLMSSPLAIRVFLRNKLKAALAETQSLKIVLVSKNNDTIEKLFNNQLLVETTISMPRIENNLEITAMIDSFGLAIGGDSPECVLKFPLTISKFKTALFSYCNKTAVEERTMDEFISLLNDLSPSSRQTRTCRQDNIHRLFKPEKIQRPEDGLFDTVAYLS